MSLKCGCTPDASGYGYCTECTRKLRAKIWNNLSEKQRNYDRYFAPDESKQMDEDTSSDREQCSCHINPPCSYCASKNSDDE